LLFYFLFFCFQSSQLMEVRLNCNNIQYILFCSIFSTIIDVARLLLWFQYLQDHTLGYVTSLGNYYIILLVFGMLLKVS
jgi:hypothetical protein